MVPTGYRTLSSTTMTAGSTRISALRMRFATVALLCTMPFHGMSFRAFSYVYSRVEIKHPPHKQRAHKTDTSLSKHRRRHHNTRGVEELIRRNARSIYHAVSDTPPTNDDKTGPRVRANNDQRPAQPNRKRPANKRGGGNVPRSHLQRVCHRHVNHLKLLASLLGLGVCLKRSQRQKGHREGREGGGCETRNRPNCGVLQRQRLWDQNDRFFGLHHIYPIFETCSRLNEAPSPAVEPSLISGNVDHRW